MNFPIFPKLDKSTLSLGRGGGSRKEWNIPTFCDIVFEWPPKFHSKYIRCTQVACY